jgi:V8-like Glu-specific endopeptidase
MNIPFKQNDIFRKMIVLWILIIFIFSNSAVNAQFGIAAECNVNVVCEPDWCNQRRSVGLIYKLVDGVYVRSGTGSLITNERRDGRPYFLTANHIITSNSLTDTEISDAEQTTIETLMVVFNYQSSDCNSNTSLIEPDTTFFVVGATLRANSIYGDWALLELNSRIPGNYNVYYNGFSNATEKPDNITMIHHPRVDIKKISMSDKKPTKSNHGNTWKVRKWTSGTAEGGSSGAPWFNQDKLVIGQQSRNDSNNPDDICTNKLESFGGRLSKYWDDNAAQNGQLKYWLNPNFTSNSSILSMSGNDACKGSWYFENANDLHTSENISFLTGGIGTRSYDGIYTTSGIIETGANVTIQNGTSVEFYGETIILGPGFSTLTGSKFIASPEPCEGGCGNGKSVGDNMDIPILVLHTDKTYQDSNDEDELTDNENVLYEFFIHPNPFISNIQVEFGTSDNFDILIYDSKGNVLKEMKTTNEKTVELNLVDLTSGFYFIKFIDVLSNQSEIKKIIKL